MKIKIVAKHLMIRNGIEFMIEECFNTIYEKSIEQLACVNDIKKEEIKEVDYIFFNLTTYNVEELEKLNEIKKQNLTLKILVIDLQEEKNLFFKAVESNMDGYTCDISDKLEFKYIIKSIDKGKSYFPSHLVKDIILRGIYNKKKQPLTKREKEILKHVGKGLSNKEISSELYVTECTVKKHITSIFNKLNIKSRSEAIVYLHNNYMYI